MERLQSQIGALLTGEMEDQKKTINLVNLLQSSDSQVRVLAREDRRV